MRGGGRWPKKIIHDRRSPKQYIGKLVGNLPKDEAEHFMRCPVCDG